jgi:hypothetical protein
VNRPSRIQLRRTPGWRLPPFAVSVARPHHWGNLHLVSKPGKPKPCPECSGALHPQAEAVWLYRQYLREHPELVAQARAELAGLSLACFCPLDQPCHADVLLQVANV